MAARSALALIQPDPKDKMSHATVLIVDITGKQKEADELLAKVAANQKDEQGDAPSKIKEGNVEITVYTQPLKQGEKVAEKSFHFIAGDQLDRRRSRSDDPGDREAVGRQGEGHAGFASWRLNETLKHCKEAAGETRHHVRWFIEPFGYAEASRAAQGGRKKRGTDLLKILQGQGFTAIQGLGGQFSLPPTERRGAAPHVCLCSAVKRVQRQSKDKYNLAMRMLDFPNSAAVDAWSRRTGRCPTWRRI